jgi:hypothetical protein
VFGAELDQVAAADAQLPGDLGRVPPVQIRGVHKSVKLAFRERFHLEIEL